MTSWISGEGPVGGRQGSCPRFLGRGLVGGALLLAALAGTVGGQPAEGVGDGAGPATEAGPVQLVFVIPIEGEIEQGLYLVLGRAMRSARRERASAIVLRMHTPGGRVDSAMKIRDLLIKTTLPTYTYVDNMAISAGAFLALATDKIVMGPSSNIGGALPIALGLGGASPVDEKFVSVFASEMRKTAKFKGHPAEIAEAFSNPDIEIPGLKEKGKILTLDFDQATSVGLAAYVAPTLEALLEREGLAGARVQTFEFTQTDRVARFLSSPFILGLLLLLGMGGIFIEVKSPGFGLPGLLGLSALGLYFFGSYLAHLSGYMEIIIFVLGVSLLLIEVFVIPGFGLFGVAGIVLMAGSLFFALFNLAPKGFDFHLIQLRVPLLTMTVPFLTAIPLFWFVGRILPHTPIYGTLTLQPPSPPSGASEGFSGAPAASALRVGQRGTTVTELRPTGVAAFEGRRTDVLTEGEFVERGREVVITRIAGNHIWVEMVKGQAPSGPRTA